MLLSLIIPICNPNKEYLVECLDSVVRELSNDDAEAIIVDNGSINGASDIAYKYFSEYPSLFKIIRKESKSFHIVKNKGLDIAQGEWVSFLNSDDLLEHGYMDRIRESIEKYGKDYNILHFNHLRTTQNKSGDWSRYINVHKINTSEKPCLFERKNRFHLCIWLNLYKRKFIRNNSIFFQEGKNTDMSFARDALKFSKKTINLLWFGVIHRMISPKEENQ